MSSVLNALRKHDTKFARQSGSPVYFAPAQRRMSGGWLAVLIGIIIVISAALGWWLAATGNQGEVSETQTVNTLPQTIATERAPINIGEIAAVRVVSLAQTDEAPVTDTADVAVANTDRQQESAEPESSAREALNLDTVDPDLLAAFENAVAATGNANQEEAASVIPSLTDLSESFQRDVVSFTYDSHMYVSDVRERWIRLSGEKLYEGDTWRGIEVVRIEPQQVILAVARRAFRQPALEDWTTPG